MALRINEAIEKKRSGKYNCAQAIACTYCDFAGMNEEEIKNAANAFGVGMGNMTGTCGALLGAGLILGLKNKERPQTLKEMKQIMERFMKRNGTVTCSELKGVQTKTPLRQCNDCVADAAEFLEEILDNQ